MKELFDLLESAGPLPPVLKVRLSEKLIPKQFVKHQLLLEEGVINNKIFFILEGMVRCYYRDGKGVEVTEWFLKEGQFIFLVESYELQQPGKENVEALEYCRTLTLTCNDLEAIYKEFPVFERNTRIITSQYNVYWQKRSKVLQIKTVEERYKYLLENYPEVVLRAPLKDIASFLNATPEHLSRIRRRY